MVRRAGVRLLRRAGWCKALKEEGLTVSSVNSKPCGRAMTDSGLADATTSKPINPGNQSQDHRKKERPDRRLLPQWAAQDRALILRLHSRKGGGGGGLGC